MNEYEKIKNDYKDTSKISLIDFNIRYENFFDGINNWNNRKRKIIKLFKKYNSDIIFFQEITSNQFNYLLNNLKSNYIFLGDYRDNSKNSEKCEIIFNKNKFDLISNGQFWLSSHPDIPYSNDFNNIFPRICTWCSLKFLNGKKILLFNTHLDHVNINAHFPSVKIILKKIKEISNNFNSEYDLIILGGCFYCDEDDNIINEILNFGFIKIDFEKSFHNFTGIGISHWDYIFYYNKSLFNIKNTNVLKNESVIDSGKNVFISDHFPIFAEFSN